MPWSCPDCGRRFANPRQWHSCGTFTLDAHFEGSPHRELFDALVALLPEGLRVDPTRSQINLVADSHLGSVRVQKKGLRLGLVLGAPLEHPRLKPEGRLGPRTWLYATRVDRHGDLDEDLERWLELAWGRASGG